MSVHGVIYHVHSLSIHAEPLNKPIVNLLVYRDEAVE